MVGQRAPIEIRFLAKFTPGDPDACWLWQSNKNGMGYGLIWDNERRRKILAHRYAFERHNAVILPPGQRHVVMHSCDTPACVNPAHLKLGTMLANVQDMIIKGRKRVGLNPDNRPPHFFGIANHSAKLTPALVVEYREQLAAGKPLRQLARETGLDRKTIMNMRDRITWARVP